MTKGGRGTTGAVSIEARLSGVTKKYTKDRGHFALCSFEVLASDLESSRGIWEPPLGSRFALALVEIDVDETPLVRPEPKGKRKFHELTGAQQAGIRCNEVPFQKFLEECYPRMWTICSVEAPNDGKTIAGEQVAAGVVRKICKVESRAELADNSWNTKIWHDMNSQFVGWMEVG